MMLEYALEEAEDPDVLAEQVTQRLRDGWHVQGGVSVVAYLVQTQGDGPRHYWWYVQALTKDAP